MKVAIFAPYAFLTPHYETDLEIAQRHLRDGDEVDLLTCEGEALACDINPEHRFLKCVKCMSKRRRGVPLLEPRGRVRVRSLFSLDGGRRPSAPRSGFEGLEDLRGYRIGNLDIGSAVLSSLVSLTRDPEPDIARHAGLVERLMVSALRVHEATCEYLARNRVGRFYVFNGRMAMARAVLRACERHGVDCWVHERGQDYRHYSVYRNTFPHDIAYVERRAREAWRQAAGDPERRERIASQYFLDRARGIEQGWRSFVAGQEEERLPDDWHPARKNVVLFTSSEDEFAEVGDEWKNPIYASQADGILRIIRSFPRDGHSRKLYVRMHPNLRGLRNASITKVLRLKEDSLTLLPPESRVSTYALLRHADVVLTFGSTVGIEAVFWGRPSVLAGQAFYRNLGGTYNPASHDELIALLEGDPPPLSREAALIYGYDWATFGVPFEFFDGTGITSGTFKGKAVTRGPWIRVLVNVARQIWPLRALLDWIWRRVSRRRLGPLERRGGPADPR
jgi:hypothetical protein